MYKVLSITTDNSVSVKEVEDISYDFLFESVNGLVQLVSLNKDVDMWLNEEGKVNGLQTNMLATLLWNKVFPNPDIIMGDVVITGGVDEEGNSLGLKDGDILDIMALLQDAIETAINNQSNEME